MPNSLSSHHLAQQCRHVVRSRHITVQGDLTVNREKGRDSNAPPSSRSKREQDVTMVMVEGGSSDLRSDQGATVVVMPWFARPMSTYRPRPGRYLWKHVGGEIDLIDSHAIGSFDPDDEDRLPPATPDDLGGHWLLLPDGGRWEFDDIVASSPTVIVSTESPPVAEWEQLDEVELSDPDQLWDDLK